MTRTFAATTLMILILFTASPAFAQEGRGYEIGIFAAWNEWRPREFQIGFPQVPPIDVDFEYNDEISGGIRFNFLSKNRWGGEVSYSYQQNTLTINSTPGNAIHLDAAVHHAFYNQIFYLRRYETGAIKPYLTGGVGAAGYTLTRQARSTALGAGFGDLSNLQYRFAANYGGGIKAELTPSFGVRIDFRHHFSGVPTFGQDALLPFDGKLQTLESSFGIYYKAIR